MQIFKATKEKWIEMKKNPGTLFLYGLFLALMILVIALKSNYHEDEGYTYGSSNSVAQQYGGYAFMMPQEGVRVEDPQALFEEYAAVSWGKNFHFSIPWKNQYMDVHPPLYYLVVHFVCSFFPGIISKWLGGFINIVFALLLLYAARKLMDLYTASSQVKFYVSLAMVTCSGILQMVSFFRMYVLLMAEVTAFVYLLLRGPKAEESAKESKKESEQKAKQKMSSTLKWGLSIGALTLAGALTHYYFILFSVFFCTFYGIALLACKEYKQILVFAPSVLVGGGLSYLLFPQMLGHMFTGNRGAQAVENFGNTSDMWSRTKAFYYVLNGSALGGLLGILLVLLIVVSVCRIFAPVGPNLSERSLKNMFIEEKDSQIEKEQTGILSSSCAAYVVPLAACLVFFLFVAKMAPYEVSRYVSPIFPLLIVVILCGVGNVMEQALPAGNGGLHSFQLMSALLVTLVMLGSFTHTSWEFLYREEVPSLKNTKAYAACDAVCIYDQNWKLFNGYKELSRYNAVTFYEEGHAGASEIDAAITTGVGVVSYMSYTDGAEKVAFFEKLVEELPQFNSFEIIGEFKYSVTAILY